jgi:cysteine-rich repeat protein
VPGCKIASCGDGFIRQGVEECDDANQDNTDACVAGGKANVCGDGFVHAGVEDCDDGNVVPGDGCDAQCQSECSGLCTNGTCTDCNTNGGTPVASSAFVDKSPPGGWTQCFGFINTNTNNVSPTAIDNCLGATKLRLRIWDSNDTLRVDVFETGLSGNNSWWSGGDYFDGCNCGAALTMHQCEADMWPCGNKAGFYGSNGGKGGGGCGGYASGGMTVSNGNGGQVTVAPAQSGAQELWKGPCYGNTTYVGYRIAIYK